MVNLLVKLCLFICGYISDADFCVLLQVCKSKMLEKHLEEQEENTVDKLEEKACSFVEGQ